MATGYSARTTAESGNGYRKIEQVSSAYSRESAERFDKVFGTGVIPEGTRILVTGPQEAAVEHLVFAASPFWPAPLLGKSLAVMAPSGITVDDHHGIIDLLGTKQENLDDMGVRHCAKFAFAECPLQQSSDFDLPGFKIWVLQFIDNPQQIDEKLDSVSQTVTTLDARNADSKVQKWALQEICHFLFSPGMFNAAYGIVPCSDNDLQELIYNSLFTNVHQLGALKRWIDLPRRRAVLESLVAPWKDSTHGPCNMPQYLGSQIALSDFDPAKQDNAPATTTEQYWINLLTAAGTAGQPVFVMRARNFKIQEFFLDCTKADVSRWAEPFGVVVDDAIMIWPRENFEGGRQFLRYLNTRPPPTKSHKKQLSLSSYSMHVAIDKFGERFFACLARLDKILFDYRIFPEAGQRNSGSSSSAIHFHSDLDH